MATTNSIELHPTTSFSNLMPLTDIASQHEKKSCCLISLSSDQLLQLNGLVVNFQVNFPSTHIVTGRVIAVLIHSDPSSPPELLFLEHGSSCSDFLDSKDTFLIGIVGP